MSGSFVYEGVEVKKTGRIASRQGAGARMVEVVEITPVNDYDGTWKKWVAPGALFVIQETNANESK